MLLALKSSRRMASEVACSKRRRTSRALPKPFLPRLFIMRRTTTLVSRTSANNAAQRGLLLINGGEAHGAARTRSGDVLTLHAPPSPPLSAPEVRRLENFFEELTSFTENGQRGAGGGRDGRLEVLYEDDDLAVVFKPPGVHSTAWAGSRKRWGALTLGDALPLLLTPPPFLTPPLLPSPTACMEATAA